MELSELSDEELILLCKQTQNNINYYDNMQQGVKIL